MKIIIETKDDKYVAGVYADDGENTENDTIIDCAVNGFLLVFTPSSNTCYKMLAADMFTQDNINNATEYVTDVIDYAVDKVKELSPTTGNERS